MYVFTQAAHGNNKGKTKPFQIVPESDGIHEKTTPTTPSAKGIYGHKGSHFEFEDGRVYSVQRSHFLAKELHLADNVHHDDSHASVFFLAQFWKLTAGTQNYAVKIADKYSFSEFFSHRVFVICSKSDK